MEKYIYSLVAFASTDLIGTLRFKKICNHFQDISEFLNCDTKFQMEFLNIQSEVAETRLKTMKKRADYILDTCQKQNISIIPISNPMFPQQLKQIVDPPYIIFTQGFLKPDVSLIGVIGTRQYTKEGKDINQWFCRHFVQNNLGIISGLAKGHDSIALETALKHEGFTAGVLGTAIDTIYPKSSSHLYEQIKERGVLISEYPPGTQTQKWRFPRRNRILSALSQALIVIQAPKKSGTMITVKIACDQGRDVYVVPGNPMQYEYEGSNNLIQYGCKIALNPQDTLQEIAKTIPNFQTNIQEIQNTTAQPTEYKKMSLEEEQVLELTKNHIHVDEMLRAMQIETAALNSLLTIMELKGLISQKPGRIYIREG
ncbi:MAG: DNA-processing protein DprA [Brevinemataceae bacterium]